MSELVNPEFNATANLRLDGMIEAFYDASPAARHLATTTTIDKDLFVRHTIETILRIRLARIADSKVIQHFARTNPFAAKHWSRYTEEVMLHDRLFLKDLKNIGVSEEAVYGTDPLIATKLLQGYLYYTIEHEGPCGILSKSYFVEYLTRKALALWTGGVRQVQGEPSIAEVYLDHEREDDHSTQVWNVLMAVVKTPEDEARVLYHLEVCCGLFIAYFNELASKVDVSPPPSDPAGAAVWGAQRAARRAGKKRGVH
jgi:hypothetical protein